MSELTTTNPVLARFEDEAVPLIKKRYNPEKILIFGSHASNTSHEGSDIDVILVSETFSQIPFILRMTEVLRNVPFPVHADYICYTPEEF
ncbi:MAG: nucleotidyltransferase domain-containing protein [Methanospirillum sp.]|nr:nucleotidyltransferase domain-containing protein [Methanospirillum sp.]